MDNGQRTTVNSQRSTDNRQQSTVNRQRTTDNRQRTTVNRQRAMGYGQWTTDNIKFILKGHHPLVMGIALVKLINYYS